MTYYINSIWLYLIDICNSLKGGLSAFAILSDFLSIGLGLLSTVLCLFAVWLETNGTKKRR